MHELTDVIAADETIATLTRFAESVVDGFVSSGESFYELPVLIDTSRIYSEELNLNTLLASGQAVGYIRSEAMATPVDGNGNPIGPAVPVASVGVHTNDQLVIAGERYLVEDIFDMSDEGFWMLALRRQPTVGGGV
jgi:hypothetical protein